ncbi:MAG: sensor histidine kinase, partial [Sphingobacteriales bacterium]
SAVNAQKGINYARNFSAGGKLLINTDSLARNVFYGNMFPNQPRTSFNYLPEVNNVNIQIYFRKNINAALYRYTILVDDQPLVVNKAINTAQLKDADMTGEIFSTTSLGIFPVKWKMITTLVYSIEKPQDVDKAVFYGKPIPKAEIKSFSQRFKTDKGVDYSWITDIKQSTNLVFTEKHDEFTIVKDRSAIDYLYSTSIRDKQTNKIIYESTSWKYGGIVEDHEFLPYLNIDKNIFKKSGAYEIIIQPSIKWSSCQDCTLSQKEIEKYTTRHTISITLDEESYTKKELLIIVLVVAVFIGLAFLMILYFSKKRNKKRLADNEHQKNIAKLQLNSIRAQLNPHFLFNALSGIQNLMNKNETDNANKY